MNSRRQAAIPTILGLLSLVGAFAAAAGMQACFVKSFWLHAMVFPLNPNTIVQPTSLTYLGAACELAFISLLLLGILLLLLAAWRWISYARHRTAG